MERSRTLARLAIACSILGILVAPFLGASYLATAEGLDEPALVPWTEPFRATVGPALTFDDADGVYTAYGRVIIVAVLGVVFGALALHARQAAAPRRSLRWGIWPFAGGAGLLAAGAAVAYFTPFLDQAFFLLMIPGMLAMLVGSIVYGIGTARARIAPAGLGWLLLAGGVLQMPMSIVLGHNTLGILPLWIASIWAGAWALRSAHATTNPLAQPAPR